MRERKFFYFILFMGALFSNNRPEGAGKFYKAVKETIRRKSKSVVPIEESEFFFKHLKEMGIILIEILYSRTPNSEVPNINDLVKQMKDKLITQATELVKDKFIKSFIEDRLKLLNNKLSNNDEKNQFLKDLIDMIFYDNFEVDVVSNEPSPSYTNVIKYRDNNSDNIDFVLYEIFCILNRFSKDKLEFLNPILVNELFEQKIEYYSSENQRSVRNEIGNEFDLITEGICFCWILTYIDKQAGKDVNIREKISNILNGLLTIKKEAFTSSQSPTEASSSSTRPDNSTDIKLSKIIEILFKIAKAKIKIMQKSSDNCSAYLKSYLAIGILNEFLKNHAENKDKQWIGYSENKDGKSANLIRDWNDFIKIDKDKINSLINELEEMPNKEKYELNKEKYKEEIKWALKNDGPNVIGVTQGHLPKGVVTVVGNPSERPGDDLRKAANTNIENTGTAPMPSNLERSYPFNPPSRIQPTGSTGAASSSNINPLTHHSTKFHPAAAGTSQNPADADDLRKANPKEATQSASSSGIIDNDNVPLPGQVTESSFAIRKGKILHPNFQ